ncbi:hypothetical protein T492DRAFT_267052 [Pavlovales sp. CCMP2436]|nr:hypothetical protein T492DRAFT_267052 [Pavlovales sp. CCMP2436]
MRPPSGVQDSSTAAGERGGRRSTSLSARGPTTRGPVRGAFDEREGMSFVGGAGVCRRGLSAMRGAAALGARRRGLSAVASASASVVGASAIELRLGGSTHHLSAAWLIDHARESRQPQTRQRDVLLSELGAMPSMLGARVEDGTLHVAWADHAGTTGRYPCALLRSLDPSVVSTLGSGGDLSGGGRISRYLHTTHSLADLERTLLALEAPPQHRWRAGLFASAERPVVDAQAMRAHGVLLVEGMPLTTEGTREIVLQIGCPRSTYYGDSMWSTRAAPGEDAGVQDTAYMEVGIKPHTDNTYFRDPPGLQVLNCVSQAERGGESLVVDARCVNICKNDRPRKRSPSLPVSQWCSNNTLLTKDHPRAHG